MVFGLGINTLYSLTPWPVFNFQWGAASLKNVSLVLEIMITLFWDCVRWFPQKIITQVSGS